MITFELASNLDLDKLVLAVIDFKSELSNFWQEGQNQRNKALKSHQAIRKTLQKEITGPDNFYFLAKTETEIVGLCHGTLKITNHLINKPIKYGYFDYIWVRENFRNQKIGAKLKNELFTWFSKNNCNFIELKVLENNPALNIYEKWGFKTEILTMRKPLSSLLKAQNI